MDIHAVDRGDLDAVGVVALIADDEVHARQRHGVAEVDERSLRRMVRGDRIAKARNKAVGQRADGAALAPVRQGIFGGIDLYVAEEFDAVGVVGQQCACNGLVSGPSMYCFHSVRFAVKRAGLNHDHAFRAFDQVALVGQRVAGIVAVEFHIAKVVNGDGAKFQLICRRGSGFRTAQALNISIAVRMMAISFFMMGFLLGKVLRRACGVFCLPCLREEDSTPIRRAQVRTSLCYNYPRVTIGRSPRGNNFARQGFPGIERAMLKIEESLTRRPNARYNASKKPGFQWIRREMAAWRERNAVCPVETTLALISSRWKVLILARPFHRH